VERFVTKEVLIRIHCSRVRTHLCQDVKKNMSVIVAKNGEGWLALLTALVPPSLPLSEPCQAGDSLTDYKHCDCVTWSEHPTGRPCARPWGMRAWGRCDLTCPAPVFPLHVPQGAGVSNIVEDTTARSASPKNKSRSPKRAGAGAGSGSSPVDDVDDQSRRRVPRCFFGTCVFFLPPPGVEVARRLQAAASQGR
jgi:hypothetical protein